MHHLILFEQFLLHLIILICIIKNYVISSFPTYKIITIFDTIYSWLLLNQQAYLMFSSYEQSMVHIASGGYWQALNF